MKRNNYFLKVLSILLAVVLFSACQSSPKEESTETSDLHISLAQWSLHKSFFGNSLANGFGDFVRLLNESPDSLLQGELNPDNFPEIAQSYGINTIELVNTFYFGKANDMAYWEAFKKKCDSLGVNVGLIMCDALGNLGDADSTARLKAVENHHAWVDIAKFLGAASIRVNAAGEGSAEEVAAHAADGLSKLGEYGASQGINIIVENHGGYSSNGEWLSGVMKAVNMPNVGTLPDFGNFCIVRGEEGCAEEYDRYKGIEELIPFAKGVSAKTYDFDEQGNETTIDYARIFKIMEEAGFKGNIGIEYEGNGLSEDEGIKATKALIEKLLSAKE
ncbi:sugar phosphate isomerase/epimerase [Marinilongibacter aquaticus]|uniref:sugar phosphate isomerase/epimerase family protein n=1 Tax=Marinilongibacter aquaticus TaxID=2975157 RepID=UPI0021BD35C9|nr:sugar phosphate isomerase/epimerase family protein [Marinilongibacter aquaticus]UBM58989.1 sugar phosphate isomerase/epimerase [Marinilongibacter aquaticus]